MATNKLYPDRLAAYIFMAGYSFDETATMLTGARPNTPEHTDHVEDVMNAVRAELGAKAPTPPAREGSAP
jgi:hypothetical protein